MRGERVAVLTRRDTGSRDAMGNEVWEWVPQYVDDVLVRPLSGSDIEQATRPDGVRVRYTLAFPKTFDMQAADLSRARVALVARGMGETEGESMEVIGWPDVTDPCPTRWNRLVSVGRAEG